MRRNDSKRSALWGRGGGARVRYQAALAVTAAVAVAAANGEFLFAWLANWTW
jgi:anti-sigma-K factor RskA